MKRRVIVFLACIVLVSACSNPDAGKPAEAPAAPDQPAVPYASQTPGETPPPAETPPEKPPIDIGDVDSGVFLRGVLDPASESPTVTVEYIETVRGTLSLTTITVKEPFPERLLVRFELNARRNFEENPVVVRARAYRGDNEVIGEEFACVLGSDAMDKPSEDGQPPVRRGYSVNVLDGLSSIPDTMLVHGRADAWLMPKGTSEMLIDPKVADSPDKVALMGNPVRINFVKTAAAP